MSNTEYTRNRYGCINKNDKFVKSSIREYPVAASQKFKPGYGGFCYLDSSGHITCALTAETELMGWAMFPQALVAGSKDASNGYWTSSATAGADKLNVITSPNAHYRVKLTSATEGERARVGEHADITDGGAGAGQTVDVVSGGASYDPLVVVDIPRDGDDDSIIVKIDTVLMQADG